MLKIAIDLTALMPQATGIDVYLIQLVRHLAALDQENCYSIFVNAGDRERLGVATRQNLAIISCMLGRGPFVCCFSSACCRWRQSCPPTTLFTLPRFLCPCGAGERGICSRFTT